MNRADVIYLDNLCGWPLYFPRVLGIGSIKIPANAKRFAGMDIEEARAQIQSGNIMFIGDGDTPGDHARIRVCDPVQRADVFGYSEDTCVDIGNEVLDKEAIEAVFKVNGKAKFEAALRKVVKTDAEKKMLLTIAENAGAEEIAAYKMDIIRTVANESTF